MPVNKVKTNIIRWVSKIFNWQNSFWKVKLTQSLNIERISQNKKITYGKKLYDGIIRIRQIRNKSTKNDIKKEVRGFDYFEGKITTKT